MLPIFNSIFKPHRIKFSVMESPASAGIFLHAKLSTQTRQLTLMLDLFPFINELYLLDVHENLLNRVFELSKILTDSRRSGTLQIEIIALVGAVQNNELRVNELEKQIKLSLSKNPYPRIISRMGGCFYCSKELNSKSPIRKKSIHGISVDVPVCTSCDQALSEKKELQVLVVHKSNHRIHWSVAR